MSDMYPLDFDTLKKGDVIAETQLEQIYQVNRRKEPDKFRLKMLTLREDIERARPDLLCRCDGADVRVMTDQEAEEHTWERIGHAVRSMGKNTKRRAVINRSGFDDVQMKTAESRDRASTMLALSTRKVLARANREARLLAAPKKKPEGGAAPAAAE
jgi:hypothetical protein